MDQGSGNIRPREPSNLLLLDISSSVLIPDPYVHIVLVQSQVVLSTRIRDQSGAVPSISTIATYPVSLIALIPDLETISEFEILLVG